MRRLLEERHLLEGGTYFNVDIQRCAAFQRAVLIRGPALLRGNTVLHFNLFSILFCRKKNKDWENNQQSFTKNFEASFFSSIRQYSSTDILQVLLQWLDHQQSELQVLFCRQLLTIVGVTALKMKFSIKDFFSKCDQIRRVTLTRNP